MAGLVKHPHMLGYKFICPRNISSVNSHPFLKTPLLTLNTGHSLKRIKSTSTHARTHRQKTTGIPDSAPGFSSALMSELLSENSQSKASFRVEQRLKIKIPYDS